MTNTSISFLEKYVGFIACAVLSAIKWMLSPFGRENLPVEKSKKIVFVKFIEQGAFVLHQSAFREAAIQYGKENIFICTFLSNRTLIELLKVIPSDNVIYINEQSLFLFAIGYMKAIINIRKKGIDTAIDLEFFSAATAIFCYLCGARKRAGYHRYMGSQNYRGDLFTHRLSYSHYISVAESSWCLLKSLELPASTLPALDLTAFDTYTPPSFIPDASDEERLKILLGDLTETGTQIIVINPSLNDVLPLRKWPASNYNAFISMFRSRFPEYKFVFTGRADEWAMTNQILAPAGLPEAINLCGKTELRDILTLYTHARLLLTSDSGPGHFATLTQIYSVVLFGPETPVLYAPISPRTKVLYKALPCSPCYNVYNNRQSACTNNMCMSHISVDEVLQEVSQFLDQGERK